jgi:hydroxyacylglutathione hydrolase
MELIKINKNIILIKPKNIDSNIYIIDNELIIDTGTGSNEFKQIIKNNKSLFQNIKTIINTHCHFDHVGGNYLIPVKTIYIHTNDYTALLNKTNKTYAHIYNISLKSNKTAKLKELKDKDTIKTKNHTLQIIHTPGHTSGSICLYEQKKQILFSGDTIFKNAIGRTDLESGNINELKQSIINLSILNIKTILPGHGKIITKNASEEIKNTIHDYFK